MSPQFTGLLSLTLEAMNSASVPSDHPLERRNLQLGDLQLRDADSAVLQLGVSCLGTDLADTIRYWSTSWMTWCADP